MKPEGKRSPLDRAQPLRVPGQSLTEQLHDESYDHIFAPAMYAVMMLIVAGLEWFRHLTGAKPNPVIYTVAAGMAVLYAAIKIWRAKKRLTQIKLGRDGERAVAEHLEWLRRLDFVVFHDVPNGDANVDHVVIGPQGVFTIETKTHSKPVRGECKVTVASGEVFANGHRIDRNPLVQAKALAKFIENEPVRHSLDEVKAMASALRSYVRAQGTI